MSMSIVYLHVSFVYVQALFVYDVCVDSWMSSCTVVKEGGLMAADVICVTSVQVSFVYIQVFNMYVYVSFVCE